MTRKLFDEGLFSLIDEASAIGVGWQLTFYTANTTNTINSYSAPVGGVANTIPVLSDAEGRFPQMWLDDGQSVKWVLADDLGQIITTVDNFDIPSSPPSFTPALDDFLAGNEPLPIADGGTGQTGAVNALAALGGFPLAGGTVTGNIIRSTKGVHHFWDSAAMTNGGWSLTASADPDPTSLPGQVWAKY